MTFEKDLNFPYKNIKEILFVLGGENPFLAKEK
jgi:hypothetical protein